MQTRSEGAPTLRELQHWLAALIASGKPFDTLLHKGGACEAVIAPGGADRAARLAVYINGYPARLQEALVEQFPAIAHILGAGAFAELVHRYLEAVPLRSYNLNDAGADLTEFLRHDRLTTSLPFLPDLARLECAVARAFHAHEEPVLDPTPLAHWTPEQWERAVLRFQPWVSVLISDWPIREIWECRETPVEHIDIDVRHRTRRLLVRRMGFAIVCEPLHESETLALTALLAGRTLGAVLAALRTCSDDPETIGGWFARWAALRMITECDVRTPG